MAKEEPKKLEVEFEVALTSNITTADLERLSEASIKVQEHVAAFAQVMIELTPAIVEFLKVYGDILEKSKIDESEQDE